MAKKSKKRSKSQVQALRRSQAYLRHWVQLAKRNEATAADSVALLDRAQRELIIARVLPTDLTNALNQLDPTPEQAKAAGKYVIQTLKDIKRIIAKTEG